MAAEAQHATRSREQGSFAPRPPRMPVPANSLAATFTLSRRRGVEWPEPAFGDLADATEEMLDRLDRISAALASLSHSAAEEMDRAEGDSRHHRAMETYLLLEGVRDQMIGARLIANAINQRSYTAKVSA